MDMLFWWFAFVNYPLPATLQLVNMSGPFLGATAMIIGGFPHLPSGDHQPGTLGRELALKNENISVAIFLVGLILFLFGTVWTVLLAALILPVYLYVRRRKVITE